MSLKMLFACAVASQISTTEIRVTKPDGTVLIQKGSIVQPCKQKRLNPFYGRRHVDELRGWAEPKKEDMLQ